MTDVGIREKQEDFIGQLLRLIQEGEKTQALEKILELSDGEKLDTIDTLSSKQKNTTYLRLYLRIAKTFHQAKSFTKAIDRTNDLYLARDLARASDFALDLASDLARASAPTLARVLIRDLANIHDRASAHDHASALAHTLNPARNLAYDFALALDLARDVEFAYKDNSILGGKVRDLFQAADILTHFLSGVLPQEMLEEASSSYYRNLADALDEVLFIHGRDPSEIFDLIAQVIESLLEKNPLHITLEGLDRITPDAMINQIAPYLQGLNNYLRINAEIKGQAFEGIRIVQMHNMLPKIELIGLGDTIRAAKEYIQARWTRDEDIEAKNIENEAKRKAIETRDLENEKLRLETEILRLKAEQDLWRMQLENSKLEAEVRAQYLEQESKAMRENLEVRQALFEQEQREQTALIQRDRVYLQIATEHIDREAPHLPLEKRIQFIAQLALIIRQRNESGLTGRFGLHDEPRPDLPNASPPGLSKPSNKPEN